MSLPFEFYVTSFPFQPLRVKNIGINVTNQLVDQEMLLLINQFLVLSFDMWTFSFHLIVIFFLLKRSQTVAAKPVYFDQKFTWVEFITFKIIKIKLFKNYKVSNGNVIRI